MTIIKKLFWGIKLGASAPVCLLTASLTVSTVVLGVLLRTSTLQNADLREQLALAETRQEQQTVTVDETVRTSSENETVNTGEVRLFNGVVQVSGQDGWEDFCSIEEFTQSDPVELGRQKMAEIVKANQEALENGSYEAGEDEGQVPAGKERDVMKMVPVIEKIAEKPQKTTEKSQSSKGKTQTQQTAPEQETGAGADQAASVNDGNDNSGGGTSGGGGSTPSGGGSADSAPSGGGGGSSDSGSPSGGGSSDGGSSSGGGSSDSGGSSGGGSSDSGSSSGGGSSDSGSSSGGGDGEDIGWIDEIL